MATVRMDLTAFVGKLLAEQDGHVLREAIRLQLTSQRSGGCGGSDICVLRRQAREDDSGWEPPVNFGDAADGYVNRPAGDLTMALFEDARGSVLTYFSSSRSRSTVMDIYQSLISCRAAARQQALRTLAEHARQGVRRAQDTFNAGQPTPVLRGRLLRAVIPACLRS